MDFLYNFLPSSPTFFIYYLLAVSIFGLILIFLISKLQKKEQKSKKLDLDIDILIEILKNPESTEKDLLKALMLFNDNFKVDDNKKKSFEFFKEALNHKNRTKKIFDYFHGTILPKNLKYKKELDDLEKEALNK